MPKPPQETPVNTGTLDRRDANKQTKSSPTKTATFTSSTSGRASPTRASVPSNEHKAQSCRRAMTIEYSV